MVSPSSIRCSRTARAPRSSPPHRRRHRSREIAWSAADALPFPVCISSTYLEDDGMKRSLTGISVAYGNVVLADHGLTMPVTALDVVPEPTLFYPSTADRCDPTPREPFPVRYRPQLPDRPLTQAVPLPLTGSPRYAEPGRAPDDRRGQRARHERLHLAARLRPTRRRAGHSTSASSPLRTPPTRRTSTSPSSTCRTPGSRSCSSASRT